MEKKLSLKSVVCSDVLKLLFWAGLYGVVEGEMVVKFDVSDGCKGVDVRESFPKSGMWLDEVDSLVRNWLEGRTVWRSVLIVCVSW